MSELRKAAELVLEAHKSRGLRVEDYTLKRLRQALATEQEQEPVAWIPAMSLEVMLAKKDKEGCRRAVYSREEGGYDTPLYTHPQRKDEQDAN